MKLKQAVRILRKLIMAEKQRLAVDANMARLYGADYPLAIRASKLVAELDEVMQVLDGMEVQNVGRSAI